MSAMEGFFVLDSENVGVGDKSEVEQKAKGSSGSASRKRLADISNLPLSPKPLTQDEKSQWSSATIKEYIEQLQKENTALVKLLADRKYPFVFNGSCHYDASVLDISYEPFLPLSVSPIVVILNFVYSKIIELSGFELRKLMVSLEKMQQQNLQLAQSNSQMLAELNSGKDRLKALQHELGCKNGLLIAKRLELEGKAKTRTGQKMENKVEMTKFREMGVCTVADRDNDKPCIPSRRQQSKSLGPSTVKQVQDKEKAENKRLRARRQSARFRHEEPKPTELLFKNDVKPPVCPFPDDKMQENDSNSMCVSVKNEEKEGDSPPGPETQECRRSSIARPSRQAAKKVQSYKEVPLKMKLRRTE